MLLLPGPSRYISPVLRLHHIATIRPMDTNISVRRQGQVERETGDESNDNANGRERFHFSKPVNDTPFEVGPRIGRNGT